MEKDNDVAARLDAIQAEIATLKSDISELKANKRTTINSPSLEEQLSAVDGLANLLDDDEKIRFGAFMDAEESRKAAIYG